MQSYHSVAPEQLENVFRLLGHDWALVTAADGDRVNTMTVSWGGMGVLWHKPVAFLFIRPQRHTYSLLEATDGVSLSFFDEGFRPALQFCGTASGRDCDKFKECGLTVCEKEGVPFVGEARLVLLCRKLYAAPLEPAAFIDPALLKSYTGDDLHKMYIVEIKEALLRDRNEE